MNKIKISPSILSCDFGHLADEIKKSEEAGVDSFHLDIMDGHFVPNISYGPPIIAQVRKLTTLFLDAHLMIDNPWLYLEDYAVAGADIITLHAESYDIKTNDVEVIKTKPRFVENINEVNLKRDIRKIKKLGKKVGLALNPGTTEAVIYNLLTEVDMILVMSVNPGFSGQKFMPVALKKIKHLRSKFSKEINVDGGINAETAPQAVAAGANTLVSASYFYGANNYLTVVKKLKNI